MDTVSCSVCLREIGRLGISQHAEMHRREFRRAVGRDPTDYQEVREAYDRDTGAILPSRVQDTARPEPVMQTTLDEHTPENTQQCE